MSKPKNAAEFKYMVGFRKFRKYVLIEKTNLRVSRLRVRKSTIHFFGREEKHVGQWWGRDSRNRKGRGLGRLAKVPSPC